MRLDEVFQRVAEFSEKHSPQQVVASRIVPLVEDGGGGEDEGVVVVVEAEEVDGVAKRVFVRVGVVEDAMEEGVMEQRELDRGFGAGHGGL